MKKTRQEQENFNEVMREKMETDRDFVERFGCTYDEYLFERLVW